MDGLFISTYTDIGREYPILMRVGNKAPYGYLAVVCKERL